MYQESRKTGHLRLRHLLETTEAIGDEMAIERGRFERLANREARAVAAFNLFQTPPELAARIAAMIPGGRTLEPSAGLGRLYKAIRDRSADPVTLVEISPELCGELYRMTEGDEAATLMQGDFLAMDAERLGSFDSILMNPPFKMGRDIKHIEHARRLLNPGGRLVSLCADGPRQRARLQPIASEWIELPPGSFKSEGTSVAAAICVIDN